MLKRSDVTAYNHRRNRELQEEIACKYIRWLREQARKEEK